MQIFCRLSGETFQTGDFRNVKTEGVHPIFSATFKIMTYRIDEWTSGKLSDKETKLFFLAMLYQTGLVEFRVIPKPSMEVILANMERLIKMYVWRLSVGENPLIRLPRYAITADTKHLINLGFWLEQWKETKEDWERGYVPGHVRNKLQHVEDRLLKSIRSSYKDSPQYAGQLADWALVASNAPKGLHEYWKSLFKLKGLDIYKASSDDLNELLEHMEENLPVYQSGIIGNAVLKHLRSLLGKNRIGDYGLGIDPNLDYEHMKQIVNNPFKIVMDDIEIHNREIAAASAPLKEPLLSDYKSKLEWLKAKSQYILAMSILDKETQKQQNTIADIRQAAIDSSFAEEDDEIELSPDELQAEIGLYKSNHNTEN